MGAHEIQATHLAVFLTVVRAHKMYFRSSMGTPGAPGLSYPKKTNNSRCVHVVAREEGRRKKPP